MFRRLLCCFALVYGLVCNFLEDKLLEGIQGHGAQVAALAGTYGNHAVFYIPVANNQHVGDLLELCFADLVAKLFVAVVNLNTQAALVKLIGDVLAGFGGTVGEGQYLYLNGGQPGGECAGKVLGDNADEALDGAQNYAVDHYGPVLLAVFANILKLETLGHLHVQLNGAALPGTAKGVGQMEVQLGAVEGAVAFVYHIGLAHVLDGALEGLGGKVPGFLFADVILGHGGNLDLVLEAEGGIYLVKEANYVLDLFLHLIPGHEDMGIVLGEAAHAEQAVESAGKLVTVYQAQLSHAQGQVAVGVGLSLVNQHAAAYLVYAMASKPW